MRGLRAKEAQMHILDLKDRTEGLGSSLADFEAARKKNLKNGYWACACGSRKFHLQQQDENVKAFCARCKDCNIIYWNGRRDNSRGNMLNLATQKWEKA